MGINVVPLIVMIMIPMIVGKKSIADPDYPDYTSKYADYPIVIPKRAAVLFDQLMVALQKMVENQGKENKVGGVRFIADPRTIRAIRNDNVMMADLQRHKEIGQKQVYWRCFLNAVTCFRRK